MIAIIHQAFRDGWKPSEIEAVNEAFDATIKKVFGDDWRESVSVRDVGDDIRPGYSFEGDQWSVGMITQVDRTEGFMPAIFVLRNDIGNSYDREIPACRRWDKAGRLRMERHLRNGEDHSPDPETPAWREWDQDGALVEEKHFLDGKEATSAQVARAYGGEGRGIKF